MSTEETVSRVGQIALPIRVAKNKHPNTDGSPWGWIEDANGVGITTWSGRTAQARCNDLAAEVRALEARNARLVAALEKAKKAARRVTESADAAFDIDTGDAMYNQSIVNDDALDALTAALNNPTEEGS